MLFKTVISKEEADKSGAVGVGYFCDLPVIIMNGDRWETKPITDMWLTINRLTKEEASHLTLRRGCVILPFVPTLTKMIKGGLLSIRDESDLPDPNMADELKKSVCRPFILGQLIQLWEAITELLFWLRVKIKSGDCQGVWRKIFTSFLLPSMKYY